ncbi:MAG: hypothetical protein ACFE96_13035 [Candidatus Hermodarchaeota archaeon]
MSKIRKNPSKSESTKRKTKFTEKTAYRSVIFSGILGGLFLVLSIFINGEIVVIFTSEELLWVGLNITLKVLIILLFFIFAMISIGNYKELTGRPMDFKIIIFIIFLSLIQAFRDSTVFSFTFISLLVLVIYFYVVQES